ncbi:hypothetical protein SAMN05421819_4013 [Bryocella elongata]|uniref:Uncharacterized protein n=1 Tax=Bryocella elongata TaxID=863522 RepID=A0A1H6BWR1_9BACT|nr:hypothetical protein [Bryocella elongata]SEG65144.1 hypothetical protein SAMN05421819_4013 [Bryocella elongata]
MFDQFQNRNNRPGEPRWIGPKILAGAAVGLLVAAGLCGAGSLQGRGNEEFGGPMSMIGFGVFLLTVVVLLIGGLVFVVELILSARRRG